MIFRAVASACGTAGTGNSHTSIRCVSLSSCNTRRLLPSEDQSHTTHSVLSDAVSGSSIRLSADHSMIWPSPVPGFPRQYARRVPSGDHCGETNESSVMMGASRPSTSDFLPQLHSSGALPPKKATLSAVSRQASSQDFIPGDVIGLPLPPERPLVASNGKSQLRICSDFAVKANRLPSGETAISVSGPGPVVKRSIAMARRVYGSMLIFQMFLAPL